MFLCPKTNEECAMELCETMGCDALGFGVFPVDVCDACREERRDCTCADDDDDDDDDDGCCGD